MQFATMDLSYCTKFKVFIYNILTILNTGAIIYVYSDIFFRVIYMKGTVLL